VLEKGDTQALRDWNWNRAFWEWEKHRMACTNEDNYDAADNRRRIASSIKIRAWRHFKQKKSICRNILSDQEVLVFLHMI
jgi:hypothetical protein